MITKFHIRNFKQLKDVSMDCREINVVIGPNGAGKSSLLQSIDFLKAFVMSSVQHYMEIRNIALRDLLHARSFNNRTARKAFMEWDVWFELPGEDREPARRYRYRVRYGIKHSMRENIWLASGDTWHQLLNRNYKQYELSTPHGEEVAGDFLNPEAGFMASITEEDRERYPDILRLKRFIEGIQTFLIWDPSVLRTRSRGSHDVIGPHGQNLAAVLAELKQRDPRRFNQLVGRLKRVLPNLRDIAIKGIRSGWKEIGLVENNQDGNIAFNHRQISDGTLRLIAIALIRYGLRYHSVVSFEEPENGVHPPILREVVRMIEELTQLKPERRTQIFLTTHNPYLLDLFNERPETIFILEKGDGETGALMTRLSEETIRSAKLLFDHSLGNLWYSDFLPGREEAGHEGAPDSGRRD